MKFGFFGNPKYIQYTNAHYAQHIMHLVVVDFAAALIYSWHIS